MGYSISDELKTKYLAREPQICNIRVDFLSSATQPGSRTYIILTDEDIVSQGLNIDRALFTGNTLELGTAISAESTITLNNSDGRFDKFHFEGAKLQIYVGLRSDGRNSSAGTAGGRVKSVSDDGNTVTVDTIRNIVNAVPMGTFWVDNCPRRTKRITLSCLDSFAKMDLVIPSSGHGISTSSVALYEMISQLCSKIGLTLYVTTGDSFATYLQSLFPNTYNKQVVLPQIDGQRTYRALFQYCLQMLGGYAFMDWDNKVHIAKYGSSAISPTITTAQRYTSDIQENSISVTGVSVTYKDNENSEQTSLYGTTDYAISISGNPLITPDNVSGIAQSIKSQTFGSWQYYPFSIKCKPMLWLYPLDKVAIKNQSGTSVSSYVTNTNFTLNGTMVIESKGETQYEKGWASSNAFTAKQTAIIEAVAKQDTSDLRQKYQDVLNLNELLAKSMGLWTKQINGVYYFYSVYGSTATTPPSMTSVDLSYGSHVGKDVVYTFGSNGFGWSTSFDSTISSQSQRNALNTEEKIIEKLVWSYGTTVDGNAVLNRLRAYTISADYIQTGKLSSYDNNTYFDLANSEICTIGSSSGNSFKTYLRGGDIEFYGSTSGGQMGKTAKMRTGYYTSGGTTTKHFAIGYISSEIQGGVDGSSSLKLGAFKRTNDATNDQFIDLLELSGSGGAVFGTGSNKISAYFKGGHIETNTLKIDGDCKTATDTFSTAITHYSASKISHNNTIATEAGKGTYNIEGNTLDTDSSSHPTGVMWKPTGGSYVHIEEGTGGFIIDFANGTIKIGQNYQQSGVLHVYTYYLGVRRHDFGGYVDSNRSHWTGWAARDASDNFLHSFTAIRNGDLVYFRVDNGSTGYISVDTNNKRVAFRQSYGGNFSYSNGLDFYCKDVYCNDLTVNGSNVYTNLTNLWSDKTNISITGTSTFNGETHYDTLVRHNDNLNDLYENKVHKDITGTGKINNETHYQTLNEFNKMLRNSTGRIKVNYFTQAPTPTVSAVNRTLLIFGDSGTSYGTIACSKESNNFAFYTGNGNSATLTAIYYSSSTEDKKKNISLTSTNALSLLESSVIYNFDYLDGTEEESGDDEIVETVTPISVGDNGSSEGDVSESGTGEEDEEETLGSNLGFVIGRETPDEVISEDGTAVNLYSFTSLTWLACQQLLARIKELEARVDELENPT